MAHKMNDRQDGHAHKLADFPRACASQVFGRIRIPVKIFLEFEFENALIVISLHHVK
jgi:hypothetical protein